MNLKLVSDIRAIAAAGVAAVFVSTPSLAEVRADVVERIKPVGQVVVEGTAQPAQETPAAPAAAPTAAAPAPAAPAEPQSPGAALYAAKGCAACHGPDGKSPIMPTYPKVTAMPAQYIVNQMKDIKSGARNNGQAAVMKGIMAAVSDDDMTTIAGWLSEQPR